MRRHPPEVYRRRRMTVLGLAVLILALFIVGIVLLVQALSGSGDQTAKPEEEPQSAAGEADSEQKEEAPGPKGDEASGVCPTDQVTLTAGMDKDKYKAGDKATMTLNVKNEHSAECQIEVGSASQQFIIQQNDKTVWDSAWCSSEGQDEQRVFAPGSAKKTSLTWSLVPTDQNCNKTADSFEPGQYQLVVKLGDAASPPHDFTVVGKPNDGKDNSDEDGKDGSDKKDEKADQSGKEDKKNSKN